MNFVKSHEYPEADVIIFTDIKPETSMKRKLKEHGRLDRHEKDLKFLRRVREFYMREIKENVLGKWIVIDGEKSIKEVHEEILKFINPYLKTISEKNEKKDFQG